MRLKVGKVGVEIEAYPLLAFSGHRARDCNIYRFPEDIDGGSDWRNVNSKRCSERRRHH